MTTTASKKPGKRKTEGNGRSLPGSRLPTLAGEQRKVTAPGRGTDTAAKNAPRPRVKQLWSIDYASIGTDDIKRELVATFTFNGEKVTTKWHKPNHSMRQYIEASGIVAEGKSVRPADGKIFFDHLEWEFSRSTTVYVVDGDLGQASDDLE